MAVAVEVIVRRIARSGAAMPNNVLLGAMAGKCRQSMKKALERLRLAGRIEIEHDFPAALRRIRFADGALTGWGDARPGHAPYCARPRGSPPPVKQRTAESRPLPSAIPSGPLPPPVRCVGPAALCQWPKWADNERPTGQYCDEPTQGGRSWCVEHTYLVHGKPLGPVPLGARDMLPAVTRILHKGRTQ